MVRCWKCKKEFEEKDLVVAYTKDMCKPCAKEFRKQASEEVDKKFKGFFD